MKKIIPVIAIIILILSINKEEKLKIPAESIRFRVIASSNKKKDQEIKKRIIKNLSYEISSIKNIKNINDTRNYIIQELPKFTEIVEKTIKEEKRNETFHINYGKNYFPEKEYKSVIYPEGEYESVVITLGEGKGDNFWCVLFPPLCLIDEKETSVEYKSLVKEIMKKYF